MEKTLPLLRWLLTPIVVLALLWARDGIAQTVAPAASGASAPVAAAAADEASPVTEQVRQFVMGTMTAPGMPRVEVIFGHLDARLRLAPCQRVQAYLPSGVRLWGKTRVGVRCVKGVTPWNVYLPVVVNVYGQALVANAALPIGHVLTAADFHQAEVNLAEELTNPVVTDSAVALGRNLARQLTPGQTLRQDSLKARLWFAAGDQVQIRATGNGFAVAGGGEAITAGVEGQLARVRTEAGRVITGMPVADKQLEIAL